MNYNALVNHPIHSKTVIDWSLLADNGLESVYREFFATFELEVIACRKSPWHADIHFRLGGEQRSLSLVELVWRNAVTVKDERLILESWPTIRDSEFAVGSMVAKRIQDPRFRLAWSFGILTRSMLGALSVEPQAQLSYISRDRQMRRRRKLKRMSGDYQRSDWMYDHTVRQMQYLSTRDHLEPHLQIDPFPGPETGYPPFGFTGPMPPGYDYRYDTAPDGPS
ncbi:hypothetical protein Tco_0805736 [Tanacetum coccineum]